MDKLTFGKVSLAADSVELFSGKRPTVKAIQQLLSVDDHEQEIEAYLDLWERKREQGQDNIAIPLSSRDGVTREVATASLEAQVERRTKELEQSLSLVRATLESTADGIVMISKEGKMIDWNQKFVDLMGFPDWILKQRDEAAGLKFLMDKVVDPEGMYKLVSQIDYQEKGDIGDVYLKDGRVFERYSQPHVVDGDVAGRVYSFRDVTEKRKAEEALRLNNRAVEASTHGVIITDANKEDNPVIYANPAFEKITGYKSDEIIGKSCRILQRGDNNQAGLSKIRLALREKREEKAILRNYRKNGTMFWNELHIAPVLNPGGKVDHFVGIIVDITHRKKMEEQLAHQATHDSLTDLPNRPLLIDRVKQAIIHAKRSQENFAILFLDLDRFKLVNDSMGHPTGDSLLKLVSKRIEGFVREGDTVSRIGGDEFIILFTGIKHEEDIALRANALLESISKPYYVDNKRINVTTSIGISIFPRDGDNVDALIKNADIAMYQAKDTGRNNFKFYTHDLDRIISQRVQLENHLRSAQDRNEFLLYYQPLVDTKKNKVIGVEALMRWKHKKLGLISPLDFIPIAEDDGLIVPIGQWILEKACQQCAKWHKQGIRDITIAVNISARQLSHTDLIAMVKNALERNNLKPKFLELEITESTLMENIDTTKEILYQLKTLGVKVVMDDFGTGYSSLSYLKRFPIDKLKIDRSFVKDITEDASDAGIAKAIIALGNTFGLEILAEGVETKPQLDFLTKIGCHQIQGFYFSKPKPAEDIADFLKKKPLS